jgi:hypothetical protein
MNVVSLCVWVAYLLVPVGGWGLFPGRPLGFLPLAALAVVVWTAFARGSPGFLRVVSTALVLKLAFGGALLVPRGFDARYYANAHFAEPMERGTESADPSFTRTDDRLRFGRAGGPDLPLQFFNDLRFNYREPQPDRATLPFSVVWQGFWYVADGGLQQIYVRSPGGAARIDVDETLHVAIEPNAARTSSVNLPAGFHPLTISLSAPQGAVREFEAGRLVGGREEPFDGRVVLRRRVRPSALTIDAVVRATSRALDVLLCAWLLVALASGLSAAYRRLLVEFRARDALACLWAVGIADALVFCVPWVGRMVTLSRGNDWLLYESQARDIGLNGLLMTGGAALGSGHAFYGQPFYPYFLATCHWVFGDTLFGVYFVQRVFAAATIVALWRTGAMLFDEAAGLAVLVTAIVLVYEKFTPWCGVLLTEVLFVPLVSAFVYTLVRLGCGHRRLGPQAVVAGIVGGLATLTRASLLLGWCLVLPALAIGIGRSRRRRAVLAIFVSTMIAVTSLATVRNWVVARQFVPIASEGSVVLFLGNPPPNLVIPPEHKGQYDRWGLDVYIRSVVEYARQRPRAFVGGLARKALYTLGWFDPLVPGAGYSSLYIATWILASIGVAALRWIRPAAPYAIVAIPLLLAASHFVVVVTFLPHVYGDRLIVPFYMLVVPYAAIPVIAAARARAAFDRERTAAALWLLLLLMALGRLVGWFGELDLPVAALAILVSGVCLVGLPPLRAIRTAAYAAYGVALAVWLLRVPTTDVALACRGEWLFLAVAVFSGRLLGDDRIRTVSSWAVFGLVAAAAVSIAARASSIASLERVFTSQRKFEDVAACAAIAGLCAGVALAVPSSAVRTNRALAYLASALMTIAALQWVGTPVDPSHAMLRDRIAALGAIGAASYVFVWASGWWPTGDSLEARVKQGALVGAFAASLFGADLGGGGAALPILAGLTFGMLDADRTSRSLLSRADDVRRAP